ncbi:hypothetical protein DFJ63DRAFT_317802 [Scheffersomyces coipomensis]|uniref:uncharacterized protein n=1 Tax=Scheffersomyces coipomensis TaxID=1788519 RepID=UPI00315DD37A
MNCCNVVIFKSYVVISIKLTIQLVYHMVNYYSFNRFVDSFMIVFFVVIPLVFDLHNNYYY